MNAFMIAVSVGIQYGVPLEVFVSKFRAHAARAERPHQRPDIWVAKSIPDYIFRWMGKRFLDTEVAGHLGIMSRPVPRPDGGELHDAGRRRRLRP